MIGVIIPSAEINFFGSVVHGIESVANANGYNILIYQSNESYEHEVMGMETLLAARVDGILVSIAKETVDYSHFTDVAKRGIPIVFFDRGNDNMGIPSVVIDDYKGAFLATERLIKEGYRRVAHISGPQHVKVFYDRLKGYMAALQVNNLQFDPTLVFQGNISIESGKKAADYFLSLSERPDAVFAVEDFCALGLMKSIKEHGLKIPDEFGIIGFANELFSEHTTPSLSTIDQQTVLMGKEAFKLLLQVVENKDVTLTVQQKIVLEPVPVFRESSDRKNQLTALTK
jgi:LacI family transcriptional regulator